MQTRDTTIGKKQIKIILYSDKELESPVTYADSFNKQMESYFGKKLERPVTYADSGGKQPALLDWIEISLKKQQAFLNINPNWLSMLSVNLTRSKLVTITAGPGTAWPLIKLNYAGDGTARLNDFLTRAVPYEEAHVITAGGPYWYVEAIPNLLIQGIFGDLNQEYSTVTKRLAGRSIPSLDSARDETDRQGLAASRGLLLLLDYKRTAGDAAFQTSVQEIAEAFIHGKTDSTTIGDILKKNAPEPVRDQFKIMYDLVVFGKITASRTGSYSDYATSAFATHRAANQSQVPYTMTRPAIRNQNALANARARMAM